MKISVIVPVYNCEAYLPACMDSILNQTYSDLEIIVVDDGSADGSPAICDAYAQKDTRIQVIHQENQGVSAARNAGLDIAVGDFIAFVDSDDTLEPDMYQVLVELAQAHQADIAHCGYKKIRLDESTKDVGGTEILLVQDSAEASKCLLRGQYFVGSPWNKLYKSHLFQNIRFDPTIKNNEDILVNALVFQKATKLAFWDVPKYHYYERTVNSWSRNNHIQAKTDCTIVSQRILDLYRGSALESICVGRYYYALLDLYRTCLLEAPEQTFQKRDDIHRRMKELTRTYRVDYGRSIWNYRFMRYFPRLYVFVYRVYGRIRTQNNDL